MQTHRVSRGLKSLEGETRILPAPLKPFEVRLLSDNRLTMKIAAWAILGLLALCQGRCDGVSGEI